MTTQKKPAKIMDVVHPVSAAAPPTSRPIVIKDRTMLAADPMIAADDPIQKSVAVDSELPPSSAPIVKASEERNDDAAVVQAAVPQRSEHDQQSEESRVKPEVDTPSSAGVSAEEVASGKITAATTVTDTEGATANLEQEDQSGAVDVSVTDEGAADHTKNDPVSIDAQQAEIERHILAGTYAVPIDSVRRRKRTVVVVTVVVIVAVIAAVDIALDLGLLQFTSVPHTNIL